MNILQSKSNGLLKRKEIRASLDKHSAPSMSETKEILAQKLMIQPDTVAIRRITNNYGTRTFFVDAFVYDDVEAKNAIEPKNKGKKKGKEAV